jgi:hypothetical protein
LAFDHHSTSYTFYKPGSNDESNDSVVTLEDEESSVIEYYDPDEQEGTFHLLF